jgi:hypothetical protein
MDISTAEAKGYSIEACIVAGTVKSLTGGLLLWRVLI